MVIANYFLEVYNNFDPTQSKIYIQISTNRFSISWNGPAGDESN